MNKLLTYEGLVSWVSDIAADHPQIELFGHGMPWIIDDKTERVGTQAAYPCLFFTPKSSAMLGQSMEYTIDLYCFDRGLGKGDGEITVLSDMHQVLFDVVKKLKYPHPVYTIQQEPIIANPYVERFADGTAGWVATVTVQTPLVASDCNVPSLS